MSEEHGVYSGVVDIARNGVDEVIRLRALNAELVEALRRISFAKPDQLDHAVDVAIIERCAEVASAALAKATTQGEMK